MNSKSVSALSRHSTSNKSHRQNDAWIGQVVCKNYQILSVINEGSFGRIYKAMHLRKKDFYAVKLVERNARNKLCETMMTESQIIYKINGIEGFPRLFYYIQDTTHSYLVQSLLCKGARGHCR